MGKGFVVSHTKVSVDVAFRGTLHGYVELTLAPTAATLKTVWLNARSMNVLGVKLKVNNSTIPLDYVHLPPATPFLSNPDIHTYPELKRSLWKATNEGEEGELGISIPEGCIKPAAVQDPKETAWEQFTIQVDYEVVRPGEGIVAVRPDEGNTTKFPHVFTGSSDTSARTWMPCVESLWDRCTWDLEFVAPKALYAAGEKRIIPSEFEDVPDEEEEDEDEEEWPVTVVASGELIEQVVHPKRSDKVIWHYAIMSPVSAQQIAWAMGPFVQVDVGAQSSADDDEEGAEVAGAGGEMTKVYAFCLLGKEEEMVHSVGIVRQALEFYTTNYGSYPFTNYVVAFVDALASGSPTFHSAAMTLFSSNLLHPAEVIDTVYDTRQALAHAVAVQWSGVNIIPKSPSDSWLVIGLALHISSLFLRKLWGNNEYRFRLKKDIMRCVAQDVQKEPICVPARHTVPEPAQLQFIALKAPLVLFILDKHLRKSGTSLGLDKVIPKLFLSSITGDLGSHGAMTQNAISSNSFQRMCRKNCGASGDGLRIFFDQWVYGSGCPTFVVQAAFNRKRMAIELSIKQECMAYEWSRTSPWEENSHLRPIQVFDGHMTIRIHEADGTPYEHVLAIQDQFKKHDVPFNTKYKRVRRNTKRYQARAAAASAAANGDTDAQEDLTLMDVGFGLSMWEEEEEREKWRVADWTEEDDLTMSQATYEWIRVDADFEWICGIIFEQPDFMWISQLQRDRDVVAQIEAIHALSRIPSPVVASNLTKTILVANYFFRIRLEAALALTTCATAKTDWLGLFQLFKLYESRYCFEPPVEKKDPFAFRPIPKPNNFCDLIEYFLKKTLITAISMVRDEAGHTPQVVLQFLVDVLQFNDNSLNQFSDAYYLASVLNALGHAFVAVVPKERALMVQDGDVLGAAKAELLHVAEAEVSRILNADRLVPSYRNVVTCAAVEWRLKLTMAGFLTEDLMMFYSLTRIGSYPPVRVAAFEALLLLGVFDILPLISYFFAVLREDSSLLVRRRLAQAMVHCIPILVATDTLTAPSTKPSAFVEEIGGEVAAAAAADKENELMLDIDKTVLKSLRKDIGRSRNFRDGLLHTLNDINADPEVRLCLLKICEATIKPAQEPVPKIRIRVPINVSEPSTPAAGPLGPIRAKANKAPVGTKKAASRDASPEQPLRSIFASSSARAAPTKPAKAKKPPKQIKSQAAGMTVADIKACQSVLKKIMPTPVASMFRVPVDPVKHGAPGYWDIVKNPMDLGTMAAKLTEGQYNNRHEFRQDLKLIVANAKLYNKTGPVVDLANDLDSVFEKQWDRVSKTLAGMEAKGHGGTGMLADAAAPSIAQPTVSFKIKTAAKPQPTAPPAADKPTGIKLKLGGAKMSPPPVPLPAPTRGSMSMSPPAPNRKGKAVAGPSSDDFDDLPLAKTVKKEPKPPKLAAPAAAPVVPVALRPAELDLPPPPPASQFFPREDTLNPQKARQVLKRVTDLRESYFFRYPVDAVGMLATYYDEIKNPMDLTTMSTKLDKGEYQTYGEFFDDFALIESNCKLFNPPNTEPIWHAELLSRAWSHEWEKASKLSYADKRAALGLIKKVVNDPVSFIFREAVDPVALNIPQYFDIIPRENARDLSLIKRKLDSDVYTTLEAFEEDVHLMVQNCLTFNPQPSPVHGIGIDFKRVFDNGLNKIRHDSGSGQKKRPAGSGGDKAGGSKKLKLSLS